MGRQMKVQTFYEPGVMRLEVHDIPKIADNEVLVKVKAVGICGSDISYYYGHSPLGTPNGKGPLCLGHEISGVVVEVGKIPAAMQLFKEDDRVTVNPVQQCNACDACMRGEFNCCPHAETIGVNVNGGFAEYVKVRYTHVYKIPESISFEQGAIAEPLACATYGIKRLNIQLGQTVVIFGPGTIGLMMTQLAKVSGAGKVILIGRRDYPLSVGVELGADIVINTKDEKSPNYTADLVQKIKDITDGALAPRSIVATSNMTALQDALRVTGSASTVVYFGLPGNEDVLKIPVLEAIYLDRTIKFSWLAPLVWDNVFKVLANKRVDLDKIITHKFSLEDTENGIKFMKESRDDKIKGVVVLD
ncbi:sorbitol dehydrogenase [Peptococcaceae bacterium CEB3]|nr:sorbitol dehydrogenase [Peptococcaceae bacterium CEB3]